MEQSFITIQCEYLFIRDLLFRTTVLNQTAGFYIAFNVMGWAKVVEQAY